MGCCRAALLPCQADLLVQGRLAHMDQPSAQPTHALRLVWQPNIPDNESPGRPLEDTRQQLIHPVVGVTVDTLAPEFCAPALQYPPRAAWLQQELTRTATGITPQPLGRALVCHHSGNEVHVQAIQ